MFRKLAAAVAAVLLLCAAAERPPRPHLLGRLELSMARGPFFPGSRVVIGVHGYTGRYTVGAAGGGALDGGIYVVPQAAGITPIVAAARGAVALGAVAGIAPPAPARPLIAVATYGDGVDLYTPRTFRPLGVFALGGPPGDVGFSSSGALVAGQTDGDELYIADRRPWSVRAIAGVASVNELAQMPDGTVFATDRDVDGAGALTRILPDGAVSRTITGTTAEGIAIDRRRGLVYVGNVNSNNIAVVDARTMRLVRRIAAPFRPFGIALSSGGNRLYVVSNAAPDMHAGGGYTAEIALGAHPHRIARSAPETFPLGVVLDAARNRLFVTDEASDRVYVLNARTLHAVRAPLSTCKTPWRPSVANGRLYVPCAQGNAVDVFDLATLRRVPGAPFKTGEFPMSVAVWAGA